MSLFLLSLFGLLIPKQIKYYFSKLGFLKTHNSHYKNFSDLLLVHEGRNSESKFSSDGFPGGRW